MRSGRFFTEQDGAKTPPVAIINETLARRFLPNEDPIGRRLRNGGPDSEASWITVVGVVGAVRRPGPDRPPIALKYRTISQQWTSAMNLVAATALKPAAFAPMIRAIVSELDPAVPVGTVDTLRGLLDRQLALREFNLGVGGTFAVIALTLAGIGIFGLMNYGVTRRTREIGVRMAIGATPGDVMKMLLGEGRSWPWPGSHSASWLRPS